MISIIEYTTKLMKQKIEMNIKKSTPIANRGYNIILANFGRYVLGSLKYMHPIVDDKPYRYGCVSFLFHFKTLQKNEYEL